MDLSPGQVIGNDYRIVQPLAVGGMGAVYVAEQLSTGKRRALKVMHRELASDAESQRRFLQEARVGSLIASEHVVEVQNAGIDQATGHPFLVMELLEGEDLQTRIARGPLSLDDARVILGQLCHALAAAHDAHVVHRDLKPQNVFLGIRRSTGDTLHVKVLDFGIAKVVESHTATAAMGTPMWLAPEQTERGHITGAADVWALGLLVFTMLTGSTFWRTPAKSNGSLVDLLSEILRDPIPPASVRAAELGRSVPPGFDAWLLRCLSRPPRGRFPNAREAYAALVPILGAGHPVGPPLSAALSPTAGTPAATAPSPGMYATATVHAATQYVAPLAAYPAPAPPSSRVGLFVGLGVGLLILVGAAGGIAVLLSNGHLPRPASASDVPTNVVPSGVPVPQPPPKSPKTENAPLHVMVMSDAPELQTALASDATLTPKLEECVAPVRGHEKASLVFMFEVSSSGLKHIMTQGQPLGPHVQCIVTAISKRPLPPLPPNKRASLQLFVTWT